MTPERRADYEALAAMPGTLMTSERSDAIKELLAELARVEGDLQGAREAREKADAENAGLRKLNIDVIARAIHDVIYSGHAVEACQTFDANRQRLNGTCRLAAEAVASALAASRPPEART